MESGLYLFSAVAALHTRARRRNPAARGSAQPASLLAMGISMRIGIFRVCRFVWRGSRCAVLPLLGRFTSAILPGSWHPAPAHLNLSVRSEEHTSELQSPCN